MKITDNKFLVFVHILDAILMRLDSKETEGVKWAKREFEAMFEKELTSARNGTESIQKEVLRRVLNEKFYAEKKHPCFCNDLAHGVSIIVEEIGEMAQAVNDMLAASNKAEAEKHRPAAVTEAAHVAVTALRLMEKLNEEDSRNF